MIYKYNLMSHLHVILDKISDEKVILYTLLTLQELIRNGFHQLLLGNQLIKTCVSGMT